MLKIIVFETTVYNKKIIWYLSYLFVNELLKKNIVYIIFI